VIVTDEVVVEYKTKEPEEQVTNGENNNKKAPPGNSTMVSSNASHETGVKEVVPNEAADIPNASNFDLPNAEKEIPNSDDEMQDNNSYIDYSSPDSQPLMTEIPLMGGGFISKDDWNEQKREKKRKYKKQCQENAVKRRANVECLKKKYVGGVNAEDNESAKIESNGVVENILVG
jgi:hypothetical protein